MIRQDTSEKQVKSIYLGIGSNLGNKKSNIEKAKFELTQNNIKILLAGPRINENKQMIGSTLVVECENKDVLEKWLEKDIYNKVKLFENSEISEYKIVINNF